jgi:hypothetical protein
VTPLHCRTWALTRRGGRGRATTLALTIACAASLLAAPNSSALNYQFFANDGTTCNARMDHTVSTLSGGTKRIFHSLSASCSRPIKRIGIQSQLWGAGGVGFKSEGGVQTCFDCSTLLASANEAFVPPNQYRHYGLVSFELLGKDHRTAPEPFWVVVPANHDPGLRFNTGCTTGTPWASCDLFEDIAAL